MKEGLRERYLHQLKSRLRLSRTHRRHALQDVMSTVDDYLEQIPESTWEAMIKEIGSPEDVAETLNEEHPADAKIRRIQIFAIAIIAIVIATFYWFYNTHAFIVYEDPTISTGENNANEETETWTHLVIPTARSTSKKFGKKTTSLYDKDKTLLASFSVKAYFSVDKGNSVKCTDASCSKTIYVSGWSLTNKSVSADNSSTSKASSTAKGTFKNGAKSYKVSATISCTKNGTLS